MGPPSLSPEQIATWIDAQLPLVEKPARYLGSEIGALHRPWQAEQVHWLLILPEVYEIGMSHQGLRILYDLINRRDDAHAERAFAPWIDLEARLRHDNVPLFSLESRRPARDFEIVGFSLQYELLASNVLNLLDLAGIPLHASDRGEDDPLIAGGGPCTANPEPLAEFFDFILIGDGEEAVGAISQRLSALRGRPRIERLRALAELPGIYVPRFYRPVFAQGRQVAMEAIDDAPLPIRRTYIPTLNATVRRQAPIVPLVEAVQDRLTLEIQRGCTQGCRFCQAGIFYRPVRERAAAELVETVCTGLAASGWNEISLSSLSTADYSQIEPLARMLSDGLRDARIGLSLSSLRVDTFSVELADLVSRVRKTGLTFAPEAGTARLRQVINKRISDEDLFASVEAAYARGWRRIKLYFMIGLPTETSDDIAAIGALVRRIREIGRRHGPGRSVTVSVGAFVPKAQTPFQWEAFTDRATLRERIGELRRVCDHRGSPLKVHDVEISYVEAMLARADRRAGRVIEHIWRNGARFEGWREHFVYDRWPAAIESAGLDTRLWTDAVDPDLPLPWDHIDLGVERRWLRRERERALTGETTADCRTGPCTGCGLGGPADRVFAPGVDEKTRAALTSRLANAFPGEAAPPQSETADPQGESAGQHSETAGPQDESAGQHSETAGQPAAPRRFRATYRKNGALRFISHLETGRLIERLLRMAGWPLAFTRGHHPHPRVGYGPPLPLGIAGERELIDIFLTTAPSAKQRERLEELAPPGFTLTSLREIAGGEPSLAAAAVFALYQVTLPADLYAQARREGRRSAFIAAPTMAVTKARKGRTKSVDLKRCVVEITWQDADEATPETVLEVPAASDPDSAGDNRQPTLRLLLRQQEPAGHVLGPLPALREIFAWSREDLARCLVTRVEIRDEGGGQLG
ncbi:MAG: TIGR03960 family B12-binding radical SAM protein [Candidatus Eisenbacteria sp.]|nr:TIGR03960 family B12-binding radical SAM protein [Candidatus Eisenbacteria bacterium]